MLRFQGVFEAFIGLVTWTSACACHLGISTKRKLDDSVGVFCGELMFKPQNPSLNDICFGRRLRSFDGSKRSLCCIRWRHKCRRVAVLRHSKLITRQQYISRSHIQKSVSYYYAIKAKLLRSIFARSSVLAGYSRFMIRSRAWRPLCFTRQGSACLSRGDLELFARLMRFVMLAASL
jgi:hypothetical protein